MIDSQTVIERSVYLALLDTTVNAGYTLNPEKYLPISKANSSLFDNDSKNIEKTKGFMISIFGTGNNQSKGMKNTPRIVVDAKGFLPGDIGLPGRMVDKDDTGRYFVSEHPFEAIDQFIDIHLVSSNQEQMRLLQLILSSSIPQRGYIKPYDKEQIPFDGNIFIEASNFYNMPDNDKGILEKVYQFTIKDTLVERITNIGEEIPPLVDISFFINNKEEITIQ